MIGQMRHLVDIQADSAAAGAEQPDYTGTAWMTNVPVAIEHIRGMENTRGEQIEAVTGYVVEMHYITGIKENMRLHVLQGGPFVGRYFNIVDVQPIFVHGREQFLRLQCSEVPSL